MLDSHRGNDIHRLGRRNLVASDSSPKVCRQSKTHPLLQKRFISIGDIIKVIVVK